MVNGIEQKPVVRPAAAQQTTLDSAFDRLKSVSSTSTPEVEATAGATKKTATKVPTKTTAAKAPAAKAAPKKKIVDLSDEDEDDFLAVAKEAPAKKAPASKAAPKKKVVDLSDEDEDDFLAIAKEAAAKPAARGGRAAAQKAKSYKVPDDSDEDMSDGNDRLDDVSAMVKGIGAGAGEGATRFFHPPSAVRPTSSGLKAKKRIVDDEDISADETDWAALAQNSPAKATDRTLLSEEGSDDMEPPTPKPVSKVAAKLKATTAPKTNGTLKPKKAPAPAPAPAPKTLSPAAKAYAAKQAKAGAAKAAPSRLKKVISDDEDESVDAIANDILSDDDEDMDSPAATPAKKAAPAAAARPSRRAAAAKPKAKYALSDEDDEDDFDQESEEEDEFDMDESD
jgi:DNA topoisomerase-2